MYQQSTLWEYSEVLEEEVSQQQAKGEPLSLPDGDILIYKNLFSSTESSTFFTNLLNDVNWQQDYIKLYGKSIPLPRLTAWYGDGDKSYTYSGIKMKPKSWTPTLLEIKSRIEKLAEMRFNSVLLNLYRNGKDSVAWHSDDELELGQNPPIGSVSFGGSRRFSLRHKHRKDLKIIDIDLTNGSFLLMKGATQHYWQHQIPKTAKIVQPRINLTFRVIF
ncbi:MAG: alpha-ketoglutarate-dependent dioxygenase AlkB [Leptolyngbyaceae cyanobacterium RU_5_1]|nr:alpha-ketoglutarate-dependent dioxygenase AlkB [Leptolyngbyaceae cyanobacterium RU_5_1]